jgi:tripartite-type tricarboxylate transporter receptor subunit TctC
MMSGKMKLCVVGLLYAAGLLPTHAQAQTWPTRPVRIVVPFSAAGTADLLARIAADKLSAALGEPSWWRIVPAPAV